MALKQGLGSLDTHDHKGGGIGIGRSTALGKHGGRQQGMLYGIAGLGINSVGILLAALVIEIAIVAARGHRHISNVQHCLELATDREGVVGRFGDADFPGYALLADALSDNLTTNLNHEVLNPTTTQQTCHNVRSIALGNSRKIILITDFQ